MTADFVGALEPLSVIAAIEQNLVQWHRALVEHVPGGRWRQEPDYQSTIAPIQHPLFNAVMGAAFAHGQSATRVEHATAPYAERGLPLLWWLGPSSRPLDLSRTLEAHGFQPADRLVGMAADLSIAAGQRSMPAGFHVDVVVRSDGLDAWLLPFSEGFTGDLGVRSALARLAHPEMFSAKPAFRFLVGRSDGVPVSCAILFDVAGVAGIYAVATHPSGRNRGYASALVGAAMESAREAGRRVAVLHASAQALSLYRRLGFVEYCRLRTCYRPAQARQVGGCG